MPAYWVINSELTVIISTLYPDYDVKRVGGSECEDNIRSDGRLDGLIDRLLNGVVFSERMAVKVLELMCR